VDSKRGNDLPFFFFWRRNHLCVNYEYTFVCLGCVYPVTLIALSVRVSTLSQSSPRYYAFHEPALLVCITKTHAHIYVPNQRLPRNTRYSTCKYSVEQVYLRGQHRRGWRRPFTVYGNGKSLCSDYHSAFQASLTSFLSCCICVALTVSL